MNEKLIDVCSIIEISTKNKLYEELFQVPLTLAAFLHQLGAKINSSGSSADLADPVDFPGSSGFSQSGVI